jgi:aminoglycoside phosphotransferase (APT) family kinase protein
VDEVSDGARISTSFAAGGRIRSENVGVVRHLGPEIARGSRSSVRAWGNDAVAKVPLPTTPNAWILFEARYTAAVHAVGAPVPRLLGVEEIDGRTVSIFERVWGPSMWERITADPSSGARDAVELAQLHHRLLSLPPPPTLPRQLDRFACKIRRAAASVSSGLAGLLPGLPADAPVYRLCHGDLHPGNVLVSADGPVVIDWFDASRGDPVLDVARTMVLLGAIGPTTILPVHLPGATPALLRDMHEAYLDRILHLRGLSADDVAAARVFAVAARLAEGLERDELLRALTPGVFRDA